MAGNEDNIQQDEIAGHNLKIRKLLRRFRSSKAFLKQTESGLHWTFNNFRGSESGVKVYPSKFEKGK